MTPPRLQRHANGKYYIHWVRNRRSARVSTGHDSLRGAMLFFADWIVSTIDKPRPTADTAGMLRRVHKLRGVQ